MAERTVTVVNTLGIHARPASMIVQAAIKFDSSIQLVKGEATADAKSIMSVMMLAAAEGSDVTIKATGEDDEAAVETIAALFERKFNEM